MIQDDDDLFTLEDLMDVPDFFPPGSDMNGSSPERPTRKPQEARSAIAAASHLIDIRNLHIKAGVGLNLAPQMAEALRIAAARGDVITSGSEGHRGDGVHLPTSLHYDGAALDIRPGRDRQEQLWIYRKAGYTVLDEGNHLHVSKDPAGIRV